MISKLFLSGVMLTMIAVLLVSCGSVATPTQEVDLLTEIPEGVISAREAALSYILNNYGEQVFPAPGSDWNVQRTTPEGLVGSEGYAFSAGNIDLTVTYNVVAPQDVVYQVVVDKGASFHWEGDVDAAGQVTD